jgi:maleate cis-trans isomerase
MPFGSWRGTQDEFKLALGQYGRMVIQLTEIGIDVINPSGAPPFIVLGYEGEAALIKEWRERYGKPMCTLGPTHVDALHVLCTQRFADFSNFSGEINKIYAHYFEDAGFNALEQDCRVPIVHAGSLSMLGHSTTPWS